MATPYDSDQAEIDAMPAVPPSNNGNGQLDAISINNSDLNNNIGGLRSAISTLSSQVASLGKSTFSMAKEVGKATTRDINMDKEGTLGRIGAIAGGPIGIVVANALSNSGLADKIGEKVKDGVGSLGSKIKSMFGRDKYDSQSGYMNPMTMTASMKNANAPVIKELHQGVSTPLITANEIAQEHLEEDKASNSKVIGGVLSISKSLENAQKTDNEFSKESNELLSKINENTSSFSSEAIVNAIAALGTKLEDSTNKSSGLFSSILRSTRLGTLFSGKYTHDIPISKNPMETQVSALLQIYRWQRLYGELMKQQMNELIRLQGGEEKDVVGQHGVLKTAYLKNSNAIKKMMGPLLGKAADMIFWDEESRDTKNRADAAAGIEKTLKYSKTSNKKGAFSKPWDNFKYWWDNTPSSVMSPRDGMTEKEWTELMRSMYKQEGSYRSVTKLMSYLDPALMARNSSFERSELQEKRNKLNAKLSRLGYGDRDSKKRRKLSSKIESLDEEIANLGSTDEAIRSKDKENPFYKRQNIHNLLEEADKNRGAWRNEINRPKAASFVDELWDKEIDGLVPGSVPVTIVGNVLSSKNSKKDEDDSSNVKLPNQLKTVLKASKVPAAVVNGGFGTDYILARKAATEAANAKNDDKQIVAIETIAKNTSELVDNDGIKVHDDVNNDLVKRDLENTLKRQAREDAEKRFQSSQKKKKEIEKDKKKGDSSSGILSTLGSVTGILGGIASLFATGKGIGAFLDKAFGSKEAANEYMANHKAAVGGLFAKTNIPGMKLLGKGAGKLTLGAPVAGLSAPLRIFGKTGNKWANALTGSAAKTGGKIGSKVLGGTFKLAASGMDAYDSYQRFQTGDQNVRAASQGIAAALDWVPGVGWVTSTGLSMGTITGDAVAARTGSQQLGELTTKGINTAMPMVAGAGYAALGKGLQASGDTLAKGSVSLAGKAPGWLGNSKFMGKAFDAGAKLGGATGTGAKMMAQGAKFAKVGGAAVGGILGAVDSYSRFSQGDTSGGVIAGAGAAGTVAASLMAGGPVGFAVGLAVQDALMINDLIKIHAGRRKMERQDELEQAIGDAKYLSDPQTHQMVQTVMSNDELEPDDKAEKIAKHYKEWRRNSGNRRISERGAQAAHDKDFTEQMRPQIRELFDQAKSMGLPGVVKNNFTMSSLGVLYDSWKAQRAQSIDQTQAAQVLAQANADKDFMKSSKVQALQKALKKKGITKDEYDYELYFLYDAELRRKDRIKKKNEEYKKKQEKAKKENTPEPISEKAKSEAAKGSDIGVEPAKTPQATADKTENIAKQVDEKTKSTIAATQKQPSKKPQATADKMAAAIKAAEGKKSLDELGKHLQAELAKNDYGGPSSKSLLLRKAINAYREKTGEKDISALNKLYYSLMDGSYQPIDDGKGSSKPESVANKTPSVINKDIKEHAKDSMRKRGQGMFGNERAINDGNAALADPNFVKENKNKLDEIKKSNLDNYAKYHAICGLFDDWMADKKKKADDKKPVTAADKAIDASKKSNNEKEEKKPQSTQAKLEATKKEYPKNNESETKNNVTVGAPPKNNKTSEIETYAYQQAKEAAINGVPSYVLDKTLDDLLNKYPNHTLVKHIKRKARMIYDHTLLKNDPNTKKWTDENGVQHMKGSISQFEMSKNWDNKEKISDKTVSIGGYQYSTSLYKELFDLAKKQGDSISTEQLVKDFTTHKDWDGTIAPFYSDASIAHKAIKARVDKEKGLSGIAKTILVDNIFQKYYAARKAKWDKHNGKTIPQSTQAKLEATKKEYPAKTGNSMLDNEQAINQMNASKPSDVQPIQSTSSSEARKKAIENDEEYRQSHYLAFKSALGGVSDKLDETTGRAITANNNNFNNMSKNISNTIIYSMGGGAGADAIKPLNMFVDGVNESANK